MGYAEATHMSDSIASLYGARLTRMCHSKRGERAPLILLLPMSVAEPLSPVRSVAVVERARLHSSPFRIASDISLTCFSALMA